MTKYLIRLDDACPTMDSDKWQQVEDVLDRCGIKPLVGVIPSNNDPDLMINNPDPQFWNKVKNWESKGWAIALHGYDHCYISTKKGINPLWSRSEFAGITLDVQKEKIRKGIAILSKHDIHPKYFFAPSHTFDLNTLQALRECSDIRIVSDTIATKPYLYDNDFVFVPCQMGKFRNIPFNGYWTFCFHPNGMNSTAMKDFESFIALNLNKFISFDKISISHISKKGLTDCLLSSSYFLMRKIKGLF